MRAEPLMGMLGACTVSKEVVVSMAALVYGVHGFVANVNWLVRWKRKFPVRIPGLLASIDWLALAVNWLVAHTTNLLVALLVLEATGCKFVVRAEPLMAMLGAFTVGEKVAVSVAALVYCVHGLVTNVNLLVR